MKKNYTYIDSVHRTGRIFTALAIVVLLLVPVLISINLNVFPKFVDVLIPLLSVLAIFGPVAIIEVLTFSPMLGSGGTYLGFVTGNLSSLKVPCVLNALDATKTDATSEEGELISTISVAISSLTTTLILAIGIILMVSTNIDKLLSSPELLPAFDNMLAALFGGLGLVYISKNYKIALAPVISMIIIFIVAPTAPISILIPVGAIIAIIVARILYKKGIV